MIALVVAMAWLAGVALAALELTYFWPLAVTATAGGCFGLALAGRRREAGTAALLAALVFAGLLRYESVRPPDDPGDIASFNDSGVVLLRGIVADEPEERERSQRFTLRVEANWDGETWQETRGSVLVTTRFFPRYRYGDVLELHGSLETPPRFAGFDYREYLARRGVVALAAFPQIERLGRGGDAILRSLDDLRRPLTAALGRALPEPEAALAQGILLGQRASIPRDLMDDMNAAGISHLVAISGYNVMLLAGLCLAALSWLLGRKAAVVTSMLIVVCFAVFVGAAPSVLRAALMALLMLGAILAGRPGSALTAVALAAAVLTVWQPLIIDDVAFQLSFAATAGIILLATRLQEALSGALGRFLPQGAASIVAESAGVTGAASLAVLPVIAVTFGRMSLVTLPANLLAGFAFPLILVTSAATAAAGAISNDLGRIAGGLAYLPLHWLVQVGRVGAAVPGATLNVGGDGSLAALSFLVAGAFIAFTLQRFRASPLPVESVRGPRLRPALIAAALLVLATAALWANFALGSRPATLRVTFLDVGQGDAILIETPAGHRILVDGGPSGARLSQALGGALPSDTRRFDLVVLTHGQDDHVAGLVSLVERYDVAHVLASPLDGTSAAYAAWVEALAVRSIPIEEAVAGQWLDLGKGTRLEVLGPPVTLLRGTVDDLNNNSVVLRLVHGQVSFLLTGDIAAAGEEALLAQPEELRSTVLKVAHHGSDGSTTPALLEAVRPAVAVITAGAENSFGHPSPTTRLRLSGVPLLRTDTNGQVRLVTDGRRLWSDVEEDDVEVVDRTRY